MYDKYAIGHGHRKDVSPDALNVEFVILSSSSVAVVLVWATMDTHRMVTGNKVSETTLVEYHMVTQTSMVSIIVATGQADFVYSVSTSLVLLTSQIP